VQYATEARSVEGRYLDAYREANFHTGLGATIKRASLVIGGIVAFISLVYMLSHMGPQAGMFGPDVIGEGLGFFGIVIGTVAGGIGWIFGTLIASQGQLLKATLDSAVYASPFIEDKVRARIMAL
jgi:hypothetical protein